MYKGVELRDLIGKTITSIDGGKGKSQLIFHCEDGSKYKMQHDQECCEVVELEDIIGDLNSLIGNPIIKAEIKTNQKWDDDGSHTWTFYEFSTSTSGVITLRWYGTSNGYYSESVDFEKWEEEEEINSLNKDNEITKIMETITMFEVNQSVTIKANSPVFLYPEGKNGRYSQRTSFPEDKTGVIEDIESLGETQNLFINIESDLYATLAANCEAVE